MKIRDLKESEEHLLYRGLTIKNDEVAPQSVIIEPDDKETRKPKTTSLFIHNLVNALAYDKFGVYVRNLPFFYKDESWTAYYGLPYKAPINKSMTFYYGHEVSDFTVNYEAVRHDRLYVPKVMDAILEANSEITLNTDVKEEFQSALTKVRDTTPLTSFTLKNEKDVNNMYLRLGNEVFQTMIDDGYEYEKNKDRIVEMVVKALKLYLERFYRYVDSLQTTTNFSEVPDRVEVMVDADKINLIRVKE